MIALADKPLPANIDAEQCLLGSILYDSVAFERAEGVIAADFHEPLHARIWSVIVGNMAKRIPPDPITIVDALKGDSAFEAMGGLVYLYNLAERSPPMATVPDYALVLRDARLRREMLRLSGEMAKAAHDHTVTAGEHLEAAEGALFEMAEKDTQEVGAVSLSDALDSALAMIEEAYKQDGAVTGVPTGLTDLDAKMGGMHPSGLLIVAGRPSMGKTALATNIAYNAAQKGARVLFFSLEMSKEELSQRLLADVTGISSDRQRRGDITAHDFRLLKDGADAIRALPLKIDETGGISIAKLVTRARRYKRRHGLDLVVVDYLQLITTGEKSGNRVQEVSAITQALKAMAKELGVPVMALSQLSRQVESREDKRPMLSDLRESGSIEQDADVVMFVYREAYYLGRSEPDPNTGKHHDWTEAMSKVHGMAECIIAKQRHGPIGTVRLAFDESLTRFSDLAHSSTQAFARSPYGDA